MGQVVPRVYFSKKGSQGKRLSLLYRRISPSPLPSVSKSSHGIINHFKSVSGQPLSRKAGLRRTKPPRDGSASQQRASTHLPRRTAAAAACLPQLWRSAPCTAPKRGLSLVAGESWKRSWKEPQRGDYMAHTPFASYMWIYSYIFIHVEHRRKELGTHEETIFQPLSYVPRAPCVHYWI